MWDNITLPKNHKQDKDAIKPPKMFPCSINDTKFKLMLISSVMCNNNYILFGI